jgi:predicted DNA-binding transcriptional regulator AlpA
VSRGRGLVADVATIVQLRKAGLRTREIAERVGVSERTVVRHMTAQGLTRPRPAPLEASPAWLPDADALLAEGMSFREVGATLGVPEHHVGIYFPGRGWTKSQKGAHGLAVMKANRKLARLGHSLTRSAS